MLFVERKPRQVKRLSEFKRAGVRNRGRGASKLLNDDNLLEAGDMVRHGRQMMYGARIHKIRECMTYS